MPPKPHDETEGSRNLHLPSLVLEEARQNAEEADVSLRAYVQTSHDVMWQLGRVGIGPKTFVATQEGPAPLPSLQIEPQATKTTAVVLGKRLLEQSYDYRHARNVSVGQYVGRTLVLLNGLFRLDIDSEVVLEQTLRPPHRASIVLPFKPRVRK